MRQSYWKQVCLVSQNIPHTTLYRYKCICNCKSKKKIVRKKRCFVIITKFQNMRCFCTSEGCNSKATYPQGCKIFVRLLIFSKIFLIQISKIKTLFPTKASGAGRNDGITVLALFTIWTVLAFCRQ